MVANYHKGGLFMLSENFDFLGRCEKFEGTLWRGVLPMGLSWEFFATRKTVPSLLRLESCSFLTFARKAASCTLFSSLLKNPFRRGLRRLCGMSAGMISRLALSV
jgi:hypothetical protein